MNKHLVAYISTGLGMIVLWFFLAYKPMASKKESLETSVDKMSHQRDNIQHIIEELPHYLETRKELSIKINDINSRLYTKNNVLALFALLDEEAMKRALSVLEITPPVEELLLLNTVVRESDKLLYLNINLKLEGSYTDFGRFTRFIEHASFFRGINHCQITNSPDSNDPTHFVLGFKALLGAPVEET